MPAGIVTRFMVRQYRRIFQNVFWKNGVLLEYGRSRARVVAEPLSRKISIAITGPDAGDALAVIRNEIDYIHDTLNHPDVQERIACRCAGCAASAAPAFFEYEELRDYRDAGRETIVCRNGGIKDVPVALMLAGIPETDKGRTRGREYGDRPPPPELPGPMEVKDSRWKRLGIWFRDNPIIGLAGLVLLVIGIIGGLLGIAVNWEKLNGGTGSKTPPTSIEKKAPPGAGAKALDVPGGAKKGGTVD